MQGFVECGGFEAQKLGRGHFCEDNNTDADTQANAQMHTMRTMGTMDKDKEIGTNPTPPERGAATQALQRYA